ncbi:hypothetical protein FWG86_00705, partial [Candidatus Saccharibacteria bacterium]|nr:hypothetical protein [Candidatus Saccharibacteria bacterium]
MSGAIADSFRPASADDGLSNTVVISNVAGSLSITSLTDSTCANYDAANSQLAMETRSESIVADCITYAISTDGIYGYSATIEGPSSGNLSTADALAHITPTVGTLASPAIFEPQTSGGAWGFAIPNAQTLGFDFGFDDTYQVLGSTNATNTALYAAVPTSAEVFAETTEANTTDDLYNIFFAVAAGSTMPTGEYSGVVVVSGTLNSAPGGGEPEPGDPMQTITAANCPTVRTRAVDARDGNTYWVRKIPGTGTGGTDLCWMETNLAYAGGGSNTYGDAISGMTLGSSANGNIASGQACYGNNATMAANPTTMCYWIPLNANPTSGSTDPSGATDGGVGINNTTADARPTSTRAQFGYLYSWCTAMAGQSAACQTTAATQPDPDVSICPAGWRLPTGAATTGEFTLLNNTINGGATNNPNSNPPGVGLFAQGLYLYAGYFSIGSFTNQGSSGL